MWLMLCIVVLLVLAVWGAAWVLAEVEGLFQPPSEWGVADE